MSAHTPEEEPEVQMDTSPPTIVDISAPPTRKDITAWNP